MAPKMALPDPKSLDQVSAPSGIVWPGGKKFAFTIIDDTDMVVGDTEPQALDRVRRVYDLLLECGLKTTKTSWITSKEQAGGWSISLENQDYLKWIMDLRSQRAEIAIHGTANSSSKRAETIRALDFYFDVMGKYPRIHTNHVGNLDNLYWYEDRLTGLISSGYKAFNRLKRGQQARSLGHQEGSEYFWGDICRERISYVRNFTFQDINTLRNDPWMPYHSPHHPFVREWFSASDGIDRRQFVQLISEGNQDRLLEEGGACIVYTHLAFGFSSKGQIDPTFAALIRRLSRLPGYFAPVSDVLDFLKTRRAGAGDIPPSHLSQLQMRWLRDRLLPKWRRASNGATVAP